MKEVGLAGKGERSQKQAENMDARVTLPFHLRGQSRIP